MSTLCSILFFLIFNVLLRSKAYVNSMYEQYKIVGGQNASIIDYPYQVSVAYRNEHICGGSILNELYILTAAHCTYGVDSTDFSIRVNSTYLNEGGNVYKVLKIYIHPNFDDITYDSDISILLVNARITYGNGVQPIIYMYGSKGTILGNGEVAVATGWGQTGNHEPLSHQLQVVTLPVITTKTCAAYYPTGYITQNMFCAGCDQGGKDTCQGDSGGPLVISGIQIGITSWGPDSCAAPKRPGVFTKISSFGDYIDSIINT